MITVPEAFFKSDEVQVLLRDGPNAVVQKSTSVLNPDNDRYVSTHAVTIVRRGTLKLQIPDGPTITVVENNMIFIPRGLYMISDIIPTPDPFEALVLFFSEEVLHDFLDEFSFLEQQGAPGLPAPFIMPIEDDLEHFLSEGFKHYGTADSAMVIPKLKEFLYLNARGVRGKTFIQQLNLLNCKRKESIQSFMEKNFDKPLKLADYAHLTGRSIATFHRDFKRHFGVAPKTWILKKRMLRSRDRLADPGVHVSRLAYESGYENVSHFIKAFQKEFGISPKQYQIELRKEVLI